MSRGPSAAVAAAARQHAQPHDNRDKLLEITKTAEIAREIEQRIAELEQNLSDKRAALNAIYYDRLPSLLAEARLDNFTLSARGNSPAVEYKMTPVYRASISAEWAPKRQEAGFEVLRRLKAEALIKNKIEVQLSKGSATLTKKVVAALRRLGINPTVKESVHHGTLGAWLKELYTEKKKTLPSRDLEAIGGFVGRVVRPKTMEAE